MNMKDLVLSSLNEIDLILDEELSGVDTTVKTQNTKIKFEEEKNVTSQEIIHEELIISDKDIENEKFTPSQNEFIDKRFIEREALLSNIDIDESREISEDENSNEADIQEQLKEVVSQTNKIKLSNVSKEIEKLLNEVNENKEFLVNLRERLLVLFEGLKSPKNDKTDAKIDLILNFLEYLLANIEHKLDKSR